MINVERKIRLRDIIPPDQLNKLRRLGNDLRVARLESAKKDLDNTPFIQYK